MPVAGAERDAASLHRAADEGIQTFPAEHRERRFNFAKTSLERVGPVRLQMEALVGALCGKLLFPGLLRQRW